MPGVEVVRISDMFVRIMLWLLYSINDEEEMAALDYEFPLILSLSLLFLFFSSVLLLLPYLLWKPASLLQDNQRVNWASLVWSSKYILRHSFIPWLDLEIVCRQKINCSNGRLLIMMCVCILCNCGQGEIEHLFFSCSFSHGEWMKV